MPTLTPEEYFGSMPANQWVNQLALSLLQRFQTVKRTLENTQNFDAFRASITRWQESKLANQQCTLEETGSALFQICREYAVLEVVCPDPRRMASSPGPVRGASSEPQDEQPLAVKVVLREVGELYRRR